MLTLSPSNQPAQSFCSLSTTETFCSSTNQSHQNHSLAASITLSKPNQYQALKKHDTPSCPWWPSTPPTTNARTVSHHTTKPNTQLWCSSLIHHQLCAIVKLIFFFFFSISLSDPNPKFESHGWIACISKLIFLVSSDEHFALTISHLFSHKL